jgi:release factor glutamine methyltransferase
MPDVYAPAEDTFLLADVLGKEQIENKAVLEIGCGSGCLTKIMAEKKAVVTAVDINPAAVEATKKLLSEEKLNGQVFLSDLFSNVAGKFDLIVFNPPYLPENEDDEVAGSDARYSGGRSGREIIERFVKESATHLGAGGKIMILISTLTGERETIALFEKFGFITRPIVHKKIDWEELVVIEATKK